MAIAVAVLMVSAAGVALAHATLRRADPPIGGHVSSAPRELRLEFSETIVPGTSRVDLVTPDSQRFALHVTGDSVSANILVAHVPELRRAGAYGVEWRLVGPDGHAVAGRYRFTIDSVRIAIDTVTRPAVERAQTNESSSDSYAQRAIRFAASLLLTTVIGSVAFALFVLPVAVRADPGSARKFQPAVEARLRSLCIVGGWSILALGVVRLLSHGAALSGSMASLSLGDLSDLVARSTFGRGWLLQMSAAIAMLVVLRLPRATRWRALAAISAGMAVSAALLGHPAAVAGMSLIAVGFDSAHVLAAGGWAGGIVVMSLAVLPQVVRVPAHNRLPLARNLLRAFSALALTCAAVLLISGSASAWLQLRDAGLLFGSPYGLILVRKLVIVLLIAALGAYHWRVAQPSLNSERSIARLRVSIALDVTLVLLVLVVTATLTGTAPTR